MRYLRIIFLLTMLVVSTAWASVPSMQNIKEADTIICDRNTELKCLANLNLVAGMFHYLFENKKAQLAKNYLSPDLVIYKNRQILSYHEVVKYIKSLNTKYTKIKFLPFQMVLGQGNYITARYIETLKAADGKTERFNFISIFQIRHNQIYRVWEVANPIVDN